MDEVGQTRRLGAQIDAAAARTATRVDGIGALDDLDLLQVEDLALLAAGVADAVDEDVVARGLTADEGPVGQGLAAFAAPKVMPGEVRRMSCKEVAAVCSMICCGITVTVRGVSTRGVTNCGSFGSRFTRWPCTSTVPRLVAS
jgi:hypothetical protein